VDGLIVGCHAGFLEGLSEGGVSMTGASNVLRRGTILHGQAALSNHLASVGSDDVDAEDAIGSLVSEDLDGTLSIPHSACTRVSHEREGPFGVDDAFLFDLLFSETLRGDREIKDTEKEERSSYH
jgi:hypothetical protein